MTPDSVEHPVGTRVRIADVTGQEWNGVGLANPAVSQPHLGKEGTIVGYLRFRDEHGNELTIDDLRVGTRTADSGGDKLTIHIVPMQSPVIQLDDGTEIFGYQCWWEPVSPS